MELHPSNLPQLKIPPRAQYALLTKFMMPLRLLLSLPKFNLVRLQFQQGMLMMKKSTIFSKSMFMTPPLMNVKRVSAAVLVMTDKELPPNLAKNAINQAELRLMKVHCQQPLDT